MSEQKTESSWLKVRFDEICKNISDRIDDPKQAGTDYYVGLEHLDSDDLEIRRHGTPDDVNATKLRFKPNQILFGKRRFYQRKIGLAKQAGICSAHMMVLEPIEGKIVKDFLQLFMQSEEFYERAIMVSEGSLSPTIKWKNLAKQEFWIPFSLEEQKIIVKSLSVMNDNILKIQLLADILSNYKKSLSTILLTYGINHTQLKQSKKIEISKGREPKTIKDYVKILNGFAFKSEFFDNKKGIPLIRIRDLSNDKTEVFYNHSYDDEFIVHTGDLLVGMDGEFTPHLWKGKDALLNQRVCKITTLNPNILNQKYLYYAIEKELSHYELINVGTTVIHISKADIEKIKIPIYPITEQDKIASILTDIDSQIDKVHSHLNKLRMMKKSFLNFKLQKIEKEEKIRV